jgi:hypothetical protein
MLELPNITLTAFIIAFTIAFGVSIWILDWTSAFACFLTVTSMLGLKFYAWKKQIGMTKPEKRHKVIVIKRK